MPKAKNVTMIPATLNLHTGTPKSVNVKRRVAGYARVFTDSDEHHQLHCAGGLLHQLHPAQSQLGVRGCVHR